MWDLSTGPKHNDKKINNSKRQMTMTATHKSIHFVCETILAISQEHYFSVKMHSVVFSSLFILFNRYILLQAVVKNKINACSRESQNQKPIKRDAEQTSPFQTIFQERGNFSFPVIDGGKGPQRSTCEAAHVFFPCWPDRPEKSILLTTLCIAFLLSASF